jgi:hypothetical protein
MRRVIVAAIILILLSPTLRLGAEWYRCAMDGRLQVACCCPADGHDEADASRSPGMYETCCVLEQGPTSAAPTASVPESAAAALAAVAIPRIAFEIRPTSPTVAFEPGSTATRLPSRAPPLFLAHCSMLL